jgi:hypothetical protein
MIRSLLAMALVALGLLVCAATAPAQATGVIDDADEQELVESLAAAQAAQGVCYGYTVTLDGQTTDSGSSNGGVGVAPNPAGCRGYAALEVALHWACDSCDEEDSAVFQVSSDLVSPPTEDDLRRLGFDEADLLGDNDDQAVIDMTGALALLAAEKGNAKPVAFATPGTVDAADRPTNTPSSDFLRTNWFLLVLCGFVVLLGPAYWLYARRLKA